MYHRIGTVPQDSSSHRYVQLYFLDPTEANTQRTRQGRLEEWIVEGLSEVITTANPFYRYYRTALESLRVSNAEQEEEESNLERRVILDVNCRLIFKHGANRRRENLPTFPEVAIVMLDIADRDKGEIILLVRNGDESLYTRFQSIHRAHPAYLSLHYVLFYPLGNPGYLWDLPLHRRSGRVFGDAGEHEEDGTTNSCISV